MRESNIVYILNQHNPFHLRLYLFLQTLDLRDLSEDHLVYSAASFHLVNCKNTSVIVLPGAFSYLYHLKNVTFHNINRLTLESNSIFLNSLADVLTIRFSLINILNLRKNAIKVHMEDNSEGLNLEIRRSVITSLMKSAIVSKINELVMEEMLFKARPWPGSVVCQGSRGAAVTMHSVTIKRGLSGGWITGNMSRLSLTDSNLRLLPDAFAGVHSSKNIHRKSHLGVIFSGNNILVPHLPSHALPSDGVLLEAKRNYIVCQCQNLVWLREPPINRFKENVKASLVCRNGTLASALESCEA